MASRKKASTPKPKAPARGELTDRKGPEGPVAPDGAWEEVDPLKAPILREQQVKAKEVDVVRQDRSLQLVPRMFVMNADPNLRVRETQTIQGIEYTYAFSPMSAFTLRVLHALAVLMQSHARGTIDSFAVTDRNPSAVEAWKSFGLEAKAFGNYVTRITTSRRQIAEIMGGHASGQSLDRIYESMMMLAEVTIHMKDPGSDREVSTRLIDIGRQGADVHILMNPRLVQTVGQRTVGAFSLISMEEIRSMRSESTLLLYTRLCGWIDAGVEKTVGQDRIETYIWGDALSLETDTSEARKSRKKAIVRAFMELQAFGWKITEVAGRRGQKSTYRIRRPGVSAASKANLDGPTEQLALLPTGND